MASLTTVDRINISICVRAQYSPNNFSSNVQCALFTVKIINCTIIIPADTYYINGYIRLRQVWNIYNRKRRLFAKSSSY